jgi:hypothetical protein
LVEDAARERFVDELGLVRRGRVDPDRHRNAVSRGDGLLFSFSGLELNLYEYLGAGFEETGNGAYGTLSLSPVREPGPWLLPGAGLLFLVIVRLGRTKLAEPVRRLKIISNLQPGPSPSNAPAIYSHLRGVCFS